VSKQDTHFFNMFSIVIGLLAAVTLGIFVLSRIVAGRTQEQHVLVERQYLEAVAERLEPPVRVAVAGQDNTALAVEASPAAADAGGGTAAAAVPTSGPEVYEQACATCHGAGIAGAPRAGDAAAWGPRLAQGQDVLYQHAIEGFQGKAGVMPPKGGRTDLSDELVRAAVDHMIEMSR
jgi:cytochrome c5